MRSLGFKCVPCGADGPEAWAVARQWQDKWLRVRNGIEPSPNEIIRSGTSADAVLAYRVYPRGSLGEAFGKYRRTEEWRRKAPRTREDWDRGWRRIDPIFGDVNPRTISLGDLSRWRSHIARSTSLREAHRALKIWRALWKVVAAQGYCERNSDPSLAIRNEAPAPRQAIWTEGEVVRLCKAAWRSGYFGLAGVIAVAWDTQLSPVDVRGLQISQLAADKVGSLFLVDRAKTGRAAAGTLSTRTTALISAYAAKLDGSPHPSAPVFRNRSGAKYTKDTLGDDFRAIRLNVFGASESRTLADFRRSGAVEAMAGGVHAEHLSAKMANTLSVSNALHKTYTPVDIVSVRSADSARRQGRARLRENK